MIKITIRRDEKGSSVLKWWVEGYANDQEIQDSDIEEVEGLLDAAKVDILDRMKARQNLERKKREEKDSNSEVRIFKL